MSKGSDAGASPIDYRRGHAIGADAEKDALEWLDHMIATYAQEGPAGQHTRTLKALLAEPRLPARPTPEILDALYRGYWAGDAPSSPDSWKSCYCALYAELTAPKTKKVEVWRVESAYHGHTRIWQANDGSKSNADQMAAYLATDGHTCIHVTGPHSQEVPND